MTIKYYNTKLSQTFSFNSTLLYKLLSISVIITSSALISNCSSDSYRRADNQYNQYTSKQNYREISENYSQANSIISQANQSKDYRTKNNLTLEAVDKYLETGLTQKAESLLNTIDFYSLTEQQATYYHYLKAKNFLDNNQALQAINELDKLDKFSNYHINQELLSKKQKLTIDAIEKLSSINQEDLIIGDNYNSSTINKQANEQNTNNTTLLAENDQELELTYTNSIDNPADNLTGNLTKISEHTNQLAHNNNTKNILPDLEPSLHSDLTADSLVEQDSFTLNTPSAIELQNRINIDTKLPADTIQAKVKKKTSGKNLLLKINKE